MNYVKLVDTFSCLVALLLALFLKYDTFSPSHIPFMNYVVSLLTMSVCQAAILWFSGINRGIWKFVTITDAVRIVKAVSIAVIFSLAVSFFLTRLNYFHRSVFILDWLLLIGILLTKRIGVRMYSERKATQQNRVETGRDRILIVGAGVSGHNLLKDLLREPSLGKAVGFVDDDPKKMHKEVVGQKILGTIDQIPAIVTEKKVTKVFIAIPTANGELIERIVTKCNEVDIPVKTLPKMADTLKNKSEISQLRNVTPEDLLGREEIQLDESSLKSIFVDKVVLVTGAGGSIGSELSRQIAKQEPKALILLDQSEFNIYQIEMDLRSRFPDQTLIILLGNVRDKHYIRQIFAKYRPQIVYHAAAYKHVPMVEKNPYQGVTTNVFGTRIVAEAAGEFGAERFVLISTDKAVNPTNIMGATKRVAEISVQLVSTQNKSTKYSIVRFGNVLGSSGSVIPLFKQQIENGGPITLTHESIERYFMSIPEATRLVLQASYIGNGGEIFVLDMGKPVKILDLARKMITLYGLKEGRDIKIKITGLRPGEKLYEELLADKEETLPTIITKIRIARARLCTDKDLDLIKSLEHMTDENDTETFRTKLKELVPEYVPLIVPENEQTVLH